jgi:hypothetical protein
MKRINNFFEKAPLWQVYIAGWFMTGALTTAIFYFFQQIDGTRSELLLTGEVCIKIGATTGLLLGLVVVLSTSMMRKSIIFWDYSKVVEKLIEDAKTQEELQSIFENQFQDLRKKCQGGLQIPELSRLYTIMKTKYQYV